MDTRSYGNVGNRFTKDLLELAKQNKLSEETEAELVKALIQKYVAAYPELDGLEDYLREAWLRIQANLE
jgi:hypothetical protein